MNYKLGSLFDGSGGFPLSGALCGIEPVWAAEVEPYPIAVTRSRFPKMRHLGDISKVSGAEIEPVDVITFGSPCQDLSVAGKRAGLKHEANGDEETTRSGLFMEAVRIIKEMRKATNGKYPRFALWENVPGAFSSNKGEDFRVVCEELIKIVEPSASMPPVPKNGWNYSDSYRGDGWSLSYRVLDAQYWGVPQRRRRIYLVADFRGTSAHQVLFEREGLRGYFAEGRTPWQEAPADAESCTGADDREGETAGGRDGGLDALSLNWQAAAGAGLCVEEELSSPLACTRTPAVAVPTFIIDNVGGQAEYAKAAEVNGTLRAGAQGLVAYSFDRLASNSMKSKNPHSGCREVDVEKTLDTTDPNPSKNQGGIAVVEPVLHASKASFFTRASNGAADTLVATDYKDPRLVAYAVENHPADSRVDIDESGKVQTLTSRMGTGGGNVPMVMEEKPVICLQGNGIDRADTAGCNGKGWKEDVGYTLNTIDRPAVVYAVDQGGDKSGANVHEDKAPTLCATHGGEPAVCITTGGFTQVTEEVTPTLMARDWKDPTCVAYAESGTNGSKVSNTLVASMGNAPTGTTQDNLFVSYPAELHDFLADHNADAPHQQDQLQAADGVSRPLVAATHGAAGHHTKTVIYDHPNYIVRRLTPTECARLQGFADWWGVVEQKQDLTEEEYLFWMEVRNTHAAINGKKTQDYTPKQMLTWYNKLWTDSAEYKMWGNGIALPTVLYCVQGIAEALQHEEDLDDWMN